MSISSTDAKTSLMTSCPSKRDRKERVRVLHWQTMAVAGFADCRQRLQKGRGNARCQVLVSGFFER